MARWNWYFGLLSLGSFKRLVTHPAAGAYVVNGVTASRGAGRVTAVGVTAVDALPRPDVTAPPGSCSSSFWKNDVNSSALSLLSPLVSRRRKICSARLLVELMPEDCTDISASENESDEANPIPVPHA